MQVDILQGVFSARKHVLNVLAVCKGEEVRLGVEASIGDWLVALLSGRLVLDG